MSEKNFDPSRTAGSIDDVKVVGRGAIYLTFTKMWFLVSGYLIVFGLPRIFGNNDEGKSLYGQYVVVTSFSSIINALVIQGTTQAVARFIGKNPAEADGVRRAALRLQAILGGGIFVALWFLAPVIAGNVYKDLDLVAPLRTAALITLFYAFYAVAAGYLNGMKHFARQAVADFSFSTLKVVGVLAFAWFLRDTLGGVVAPIAGFATAAGLVMVLAFFLSGPIKGPGHMTSMSLMSYQSMTMAFMLVSTFVVQGNVQLLRIHLADESAVDHIGADLDAAQKFATIPYQAVIAITFVLFPLVSSAASDREKMRGYIRQTARYAAIIAAAIACFFAAAPKYTVHILYPEIYSPAAGPLPLLCLGYLAFSLAYVACSIFTAGGHASKSIAVMAVMALVQVVLSFFLVNEHNGLMGIATATSAAMGCGLLAADVLLRRVFGSGLPWLDLAKILGCAVVAGFLAHSAFAETTLWGGRGFLTGVSELSKTGKLLTLGGAGVSGVVFIFCLLLSGTLGAEDRAKFARVFKR